MTFKSKEFLSRVCIPHFASAVIATSDEAKGRGGGKWGGEEGISGEGVPTTADLPGARFIKSYVSQWQNMSPQNLEQEKILFRRLA